MNGKGSPSEVFEFGPFRLNKSSRVLLRQGRIVPLPPRVVETLLVLVEDSGRVVEKEKLLRTIWPDTYVDDNSLMHNVSVLRKTLGTLPDGKPYIETAPRRGYRFTAPVRVPGEEHPARPESPPNGRVRSLLAAGSFALVLLLAAVWLERRDPPPRPLKLTPLTSYPGTEAYPAFSPDGRQVAFVWNGEKQDQFDIYVKSIGEDPPRRLTADSAPECHLAWSPDGAWIAFAHCQHDSGGPPGGLSLYLIPASGGAKRKIGYLHEGLNALGHPFCWTPDSKTLIKEKVLDGTTSLVALSIETGIELREITRPRPGGRDTDPSVSPDGRTLAFIRELGPGMHDIHLVTLDRDLAPQGEARRLTAENDYLANPLWIEDSSELLYTAGHQGARGVWRVGARTGAAPRQVAALAQPGLQVALSRNGLLAYARPLSDYDIWRANLEEGAPPNPAPLIASTFADAEPKYSPDGKVIAFQSNRSGKSEIWVSNSNGLGAVQLTSLHAESGSPAWSPDSSRIAFDSQSGQVVDIYVVEVANRKLRRLTSDPGIHITPSWSRDGKWIYFASEKTGRLEVWKMPSVGGAAVQVTREGGFVAEESGDGRFLFYSKNGQDPTTLWRKSLETGTEEQVVDALRYWSYFAVADDGIYFIPSRDSKARPDSFAIAFYELSTGRIRTVVDVDKSPGVGFSIAPDRKSFLFAPSEDHGGDLMLVENFR